MSRTIFMLGVATLLAACASVPAPNEVEHLRAEPPEGWLTGVQTQTSTLRMAEFVHPEPFEGGWLEKLNVERLSTQPVAAAGELATFMRSEADEACPGGQTYSTYTGRENGYATEVLLLVCPKSPLTQLAQITMVKIISGNDALYTITRAKRLPPLDSDGEPGELPRRDIARWSAYLAAISVCDPTRPDAHPCG